MSRRTKSESNITTFEGRRRTFLRFQLSKNVQSLIKLKLTWNWNVAKLLTKVEMSEKRKPMPCTFQPFGCGRLEVKYSDSMQIRNSFFNPFFCLQIK